MFGTLNMGPDVRMYRDIGEYSERQIYEFENAYKALATHLTAILSTHLERYQTKAIDMGYSDVSCSVAKYMPGSLLLNMRGIQPFSERTRR